MNTEKYQLNGDQFHAMIKEEIISEEERLELMSGILYHRHKEAPRHAYTVMLIYSIFHKLLPLDAVAFCQWPLRLNEQCEYYPDMGLLKGPIETYEKRFSAPEDTFLVIEVADVSLAEDRQIKLPQYAKHLIPDYWIVNLTEKQIEIYREPDGDCYKLCMIKKKGETISPLAFPDIQIPVSDIIK